MTIKIKAVKLALDALLERKEAVLLNGQANPRSSRVVKIPLKPMLTFVFAVFETLLWNYIMSLHRDKVVIAFVLPRLRKLTQEQADLALVFSVTGTKPQLLSANLHCYCSLSQVFRLV
jgi:hypothetical protein